MRTTLITALAVTLACAAPLSAGEHRSRAVRGNSNASTLAHLWGVQAVPVPATGKITSCRSLAADPMRSRISNGRLFLRRELRTRGNARLALANSGTSRDAPGPLSLAALSASVAAVISGFFRAVAVACSEIVVCPVPCDERSRRLRGYRQKILPSTRVFVSSHAT